MMLRAAAVLAACALMGADAARVGKRAPQNSVVVKRKPGTPAPPKKLPTSKGVMNGVLTFTRFNCAFPFCPTTALDVCSADEHYELGRPYVLATLIPQTATADMNFYAYSAFDNSTRNHYTLAARQISGVDAPSLFTVNVALNGTAGSLTSSVDVTMPAGLQLADISYLFQYNGAVYVSFATGDIVTLSPTTGAVLNHTNPLSNFGGYTGTLASTFDGMTGNFYVNTIGPAGFYLLTYNVNSGSATMSSPLPAAPGTGANGSSTRVDNAQASLIVYPPSTYNNGQPLLLELRNSPDWPFLFLAELDPVHGNSTMLQMPDDWYLDWEIDPQVFPDQWPGSLRRVWDYDPQNNVAWFKMYDECGGEADDCDENETIVYLEWLPGQYVDWYVAVEPIEPELTQLIWTWTNIVE